MLDALAHIEIVGTKATAPNTDFAAKAKKFEASARSDIDSTDVVGASTPMVVTRLALAVLALALYWWARFPVAIQMPNRWLTALELGIVTLTSMFGAYLVVDAVIKLVKRTA